MAERTADFEIEVRLRLGKLEAQLRRANSLAERSSRQMARAFDRIGRRIASVAAIYQGASFVRETLQWADATQELSSRLGFTVDEVQRLQLIAERTGAPFEKLQIAVQRFSRRLGEARRGGGEALDTFQRLGLLDQQFNSTFDAFAFFIDQINRSEEATGRLADTFKGFDSEGVAVINRIRGSFSELNQAITESGEVLSEDQIATVAQWERVTLDAISSLKLSLRELAIDGIGSLIVSWGELIDTVSAGRELFGFSEIAQSTTVLQARITQLNSLISDQTGRVLDAEQGSERWAAQVRELNRLTAARLELIQRLQAAGGEAIIPGSVPPPAPPPEGGPNDLETDRERTAREKREAAAARELEKFQSFQRDMTRVAAAAADDRVRLAELERDERLDRLQDFLDRGTATEQQALEIRRQIQVDYINATTEEVGAVGEERERELERFEAFQRDLTRVLAENADDRIKLAELERDERLRILEEFAESGVATEQEAAEARAKILQDFAEQTGGTLTDLDDQFTDAATSGIDRLGDAFARLAAGGEANFKQIAVSFGLMVAEIAAQAAILAGLEALGGFLQGFGGVGGSIGSGLLGAIGKEKGGPVDRGTTYVVGEKGPEIFVPDLIVKAQKALGFPQLEKRASGGSVKGAQPYLVGERGQEIFVPDQPGTIVTANQTTKILQAKDTETLERVLKSDSRLERISEAFLPAPEMGTLERRALGGSVSGGRPYLVGEQGGEMYVPRSAGAMGRAASAEGSGVNVTVINNSGERAETRETQNGIDVIIGAVAQDIGRGGVVAQATQQRFNVQPTGRRG